MSPLTQTMFGKLQKTQAVAASLQAHTKRLNIITSILVVAFVILYITQVNGSISKGYTMRGLENRIQELSYENQKLEVATREAQSLANVAKATKMIGMVKAEQPNYINDEGPSYVLSR